MKIILALLLSINVVFAADKIKCGDHINHLRAHQALALKAKKQRGLLQRNEAIAFKRLTQLITMPMMPSVKHLQELINSSLQDGQQPDMELVLYVKIKQNQQAHQLRARKICIENPDSIAETIYFEELYNVLDEIKEKMPKQQEKIKKPTQPLNFV